MVGGLGEVRCGRGTRWERLGVVGGTRWERLGVGGGLGGRG